ncbi:vWA domain-containing protein [Cerasicoccus fimbriatus]|uniref:vWA domain-containing protein n=1 Tax=Cerasicoccus fimbriatus TaxID=3014554 RepID=UPI0022B5D9DD|nr:vWA domain-containing protein [Cerasicoccus sp. TK19100]
MSEAQANQDALSRLEELKSQRYGKRSKKGAFVAAIFIQVLLVAVTVGIVVIAPKLAEDPAFVAKKTIYLPQRELEHQAAIAEFQQSASAPLTVDKLSTESLLADPLPEMPALPTTEFAPIENDNPVPDAQGLLAGSGLGNALGGLSAGTTEVNYFGIREEARRYLILIDTSNSMFERQRNNEMYRFDFGTIKDESIKLINRLNANTLFNVAIYEGGSMAWNQFLVPATVANKAEAEQWVRDIDENPNVSIGSRRGGGPKLMEGGGTRLDTGLKQAFSFQPEVIFIVTDGEINRSGDDITEDEILDIIDGLQETMPEKTRIHVIHYETAVARPEEIDTMRAIASKNKGRFRKVKANEL